MAKNMAQTATDRDGNVYQSIQIGNQIWMKENLKVKHYLNGDSINEVKDSNAWIAQNTGAWCTFNNLARVGNTYGLLYNGFTITDPRGLAPKGWHIPSEAEWQALEMFLGMSSATSKLSDWRGSNEGAMLKETDTMHWIWPTGNAASNSSGFTALGSGWRNHFNPAGYTSFINLRNTGQWWTSSAYGTDLWMRNLCVYHTDVYRTHYPKQHGCAIRCIKDSPSSIKQEQNPEAFILFPNPASNDLNIQVNTAENYTLCLFDAQGQMVLSQELISGLNLINISNIKPGLLTAQMSDKNAVVWRTKLSIF